MLTDGELSQMRDTSRQVMPSEIVLHQATRANDGQGGRTWTYLPVGTYIARFAPDKTGGRFQEMTVGDRTAEVTNWIVTLPHDTVVDADDRVVHQGVTYEVVEVLTWHPWEIARRVRVVEVD